MLEDSVARSVMQWDSAMKIYASTWAEADLLDRPGVGVFWPDSPFLLWNGLLLTEKSPSSSKLRAAVDDATTYMRQRRYAGMLYCCAEHTASTDLEYLLHEYGLIRSVRLTGMTADLPLTPRPVLPGIAITRVHDRRTACDFATVVSETCNVAKTISDAEFAERDYWQSEAYAYVGYFEGEAVSVSSIVIDHDVLYVGLVCTRPAFQRKGISHSINYQMLGEVQAISGISRAALHATSEGIPLYRKLGFKPAAVLSGFSLVNGF